MGFVRRLELTFRLLVTRLVLCSERLWRPGEHGARPGLGACACLRYAGLLSLGPLPESNGAAVTVVN